MVWTSKSQAQPDLHLLDEFGDAELKAWEQARRVVVRDGESLFRPLAPHAAQDGDAAVKPVDDDIFLDAGAEVFGSFFDVIAFPILAAATDNLKYQIGSAIRSGSLVFGGHQEYSDIRDAVVRFRCADPCFREHVLDNLGMGQCVGSNVIANMIVWLLMIVAGRTHDNQPSVNALVAPGFFVLRFAELFVRQFDAVVGDAQTQFDFRAHANSTS